MRYSCLLTLFVITLASSLMAAEHRVEVADDAGLRNALRAARPGWRIVIAPGEYRPEVYISGLRGTADTPIIIEGADSSNKPLFKGGRSGLHFNGCAHFVLRNIAVRGQKTNGINIDDGGVPGGASHITLEGVDVAQIGPTGNHDGIKLSGVSDLVVRGCTVEDWAGEGIDMVGCHRVLIEKCMLRGRPDFNQGAAVQAKGGSAQVTIRDCIFIDAGPRGVNAGGSTGMAFFRPLGAKYEAKEITVEGCRFVGGLCPVAFVGVDGAVFRYNTIVRPARWVARILQETAEPGFVACRNGRFERNLIVYERRQVQVIVNVGPNTAPDTFRFRENFWYCEDQPARSRPQLPTPEEGGIYGIDPKLTFLPTGIPAAPANPAAKGYGADALPGR